MHLRKKESCYSDLWANLYSDILPDSWCRYILKELKKITIVLCQISNSQLDVKSRAQLSSYLAAVDDRSAAWRSNNNALKQTLTHEAQHAFQSCLTPPPCCPQGPILIPVCCTDSPKNTPFSLFNYLSTLSKIFAALWLTPLFFSFLLSPVSFTSSAPYSFTFFSSFPSPISDSSRQPPCFPSPFPPSPHINKLQRSPHSLCLSQFNRSVKAKPCLGEWRSHVGLL